MKVWILSRDYGWDGTTIMSVHATPESGKAEVAQHLGGEDVVWTEDGKGTDDWNGYSPTGASWLLEGFEVRS